MEILENRMLEMKNVLSYRGKMRQEQLSERMQEIGNIVKNAGAERCGPVVTATFAVE